MNLRAVAFLLGGVLLVLAGFLLLPAGVGLFYGEHDVALGFLESAGLTVSIGLALAVLFRGTRTGRDGRQDYFRREGLAVVGLSWLLVAMAGALPFLFTGTLHSPIDAFFEAASGFTTTGATVFSGEQIDTLPRALNFWRCLMHWLGGIGIVLVFVLLFPTGGRSLFRSEVPGISREATLHRVRDSALALARIYLGLTVAHAVLLYVTGMDVFDATIHAFSTLSTGGFSDRGASIAYYDSVGIEVVIIGFMFVAGVNFALYDLMFRGGLSRGWRTLWSSTEVRVYVSLVLGATLICTLLLWFWGGSNGSADSTLPNYSSLLLSLRDSAFSVVTLQTSTGYATADFDRWPDACRLILMAVLIVGACAGSTGGGIKVVRVVIVARAALAGLRRFARPRAIQTVRLDGHSLDTELVASATAYFGLWVLVTLVASVVMALLGVDLLTSVSSVISSLNNIGPGLAGIGPTCNYGQLPIVGKFLLAILMIVGRLEFYAIAVLLVPGFWRS